MPFLAMAIPRFYCPVEIPVSGSIRLPDAAAHHAFRVLRMGRGEALAIFDGKGIEAQCRILDAPFVEILERAMVDRESVLAVTLVQALVSNEKMDWVVQKAVELGAKSIQVVETERCTVRLSGDRARKREEHWRQVAISACEQCGRNIVPEILPIVPLKAWLSMPRGGKKLFLSPQGKPLREFFRPEGEIHILIGPEGGLTLEEEVNAASSGFKAWSLGPRILRTETAGLAALSALSALWGDFS